MFGILIELRVFRPKLSMVENVQFLNSARLIYSECIKEWLLIIYTKNDCTEIEGLMFHREQYI